MANTKTYKIEIQGIDTSLNSVEELKKALDSLGIATNKVTEENNKKAASDAELEKLSKQLAAAEAKLAAATSEEGKAIIANTNAKKEQLKTVQQQIKLENQASGSIKAMGTQLSQLKKQYENLTKEERENQKVGGELLKQIQALDVEYKESKKSLGEHYLEVGNYGIAAKELKKELADLTDQIALMISQGVDPADEAFKSAVSRAGELKDAVADANVAINAYAQDAKGLADVIDIGESLAATFGTAKGVMAAFGIESENTEKTLNQLAGIMTTLNSLNALYNNLMTKGTATNRIYNAVLKLIKGSKKEDVVATQAQSASTATLTATTGTATVATGGFSTALKVLKAALISTGIGALIVGLGLLVNYLMNVSSEAKNASSALDDLLRKRRLQNIEEWNNVIINSFDNQIESGEQYLKLLKSQGASEEEIFAERQKNVKSALTNMVNSEADFIGLSKKNADGTVKTEQQLLNDLEVVYNKRTQQLKNTVNQLDNIREQFFTENPKKTEEDFLKIDGVENLIKDQEFLEKGYASLSTVIKKGRQTQNQIISDSLDERIRLNDKAKAAGDKAAADAKNNMDKYLSALKDFINESKKLSQEVKDDAIQTLIDNANDLPSINEAYSQHISNQKYLYETELKDRKEAYEKLRAEGLKLGQDVTELDNYYQNNETNLLIQHNANILKIQKEQNEKIKKLEEKHIQGQLDRQKDLLDDLMFNVRNTTQDYDWEANGKGIFGLPSLTDVQNYYQSNIKALNQYLQDLEKNKDEQVKYYDKLIELAGDDEDAVYEAQRNKIEYLQWYAQEVENTTKDIKDNTKKQQTAITDFFDKLGQEIQKWSDIAMTALNGVFDFMIANTEMALDEANARLDEVNERYDEVVGKAEEGRNKLKDLLEEAKTAQGGRAMALQDEIARQMDSNKALADQEKQLLKEKQQREKEAEKEAKKLKKQQLQQQLVQAVVSGALAVVNGLATNPFLPVGIAMGAAAAVATGLQIATITKQMSKLEDGGLLQGKSHSQGGIPVGNTGIEVEGNEYVLNKKSTKANLPLINYINEKRGEVTIEDLNRFYQSNNKVKTNGKSFKQKFADGGQLVNLSQFGSTGNANEDILNALGSIDFQPVVSVVEIADVTSNVVAVREAAGAV